MKKQFLLSFLLIFVMMSFLAVPLETVHADGHITGSANLTLTVPKGCKPNNSNKCSKLTFDFSVAAVNPADATLQTLEAGVYMNGCGLGSSIIKSTTFKIGDGNDHQSITNSVSLRNLKDQSLLFCFFKDKSTLIARGPFKTSSDFKAAAKVETAPQGQLNKDKQILKDKASAELKLNASTKKLSLTYDLVSGLLTDPSRKGIVGVYENTCGPKSNSNTTVIKETLSTITDGQDSRTITKSVNFTQIPDNLHFCLYLTTNKQSEYLAASSKFTPSGGLSAKADPFSVVHPSQS